MILFLLSFYFRLVIHPLSFSFQHFTWFIQVQNVSINLFVYIFFFFMHFFTYFILAYLFVVSTISIIGTCDNFNIESVCFFSLIFFLFSLCLTLVWSNMNLSLEYLVFLLLALKFVIFFFHFFFYFKLVIHPLYFSFQHFVWFI